MWGGNGDYGIGDDTKQLGCWSSRGVCPQYNRSGCTTRTGHDDVFFLLLHGLFGKLVKTALCWFRFGRYMISGSRNG